MNDHPTLNYVRQTEHDRLQSRLDAFLAKGGVIEVLPSGLITDDASRPRSQVPVVKQPVHVNRPRENLAPAQPKASRAKPPKEHKTPGVPPVKIEATLAALRAGCRSSAQVAAFTGQPKSCENARLWLLGQKGLLIKRGGRFNTTWHLRDAA